MSARTTTARNVELSIKERSVPRMPVSDVGGTEAGEGVGVGVDMS